MKFLRMGLLQRIRSLVRPRPIEVRLELRRLNDGKVELTPIFLIDGQPVPTDALKQSPNQTLDGLRVKASRRVLDALRETAGKPQVYSRSKAAKALEGWNARGYAIVHSGTGQPVTFAQAHVGVEVALHPNEKLTVSADLTDPSGRALPRPSAKDVKEGEGWIEVSGDVFSVPEVPPAVVTALSSDHAISLDGDEVPCTLRDLRACGDHLDLSQNAAAEHAIVFDADTARAARIDGNDTVVSVEPSLVFSSGREVHHESPESSKRFRPELEPEV